MAAVRILLAYLAPQSDRILCYSGRRSAYSCDWLRAYISQMAAHSSLQTVYAEEVIRCPLRVKSGHQVLNQMQDRHCHAYGKQSDANSQGN